MGSRKKVCVDTDASCGTTSVNVDVRLSGNCGQHAEAVFFKADHQTAPVYLSHNQNQYDLLFHDLSLLMARTEQVILSPQNDAMLSHGRTAVTPVTTRLLGAAKAIGPRRLRLGICSFYNFVVSY